MAKVSWYVICGDYLITVFLNFILIYINSVLFFHDNPNTVLFNSGFYKLNNIFTVFINMHLSVLEMFWTAFPLILLQHYYIQFEGEISVTVEKQTLKAHLYLWGGHPNSEKDI